MYRALYPWTRQWSIVVPVARSGPMTLSEMADTIGLDGDQLSVFLFFKSSRSVGEGVDRLRGIGPKAALVKGPPHASAVSTS